MHAVIAACLPVGRDCNDVAEVSIALSLLCAPILSLPTGMHLWLCLAWWALSLFTNNASGECITFCRDPQDMHAHAPAL